MSSRRPLPDNSGSRRPRSGYTRLDRDVAIKALPAELASDPARLERFEREAKLLAGLSHPNIAGIYGVEERDGAKYLVLAGLVRRLHARGDLDGKATVLDFGPARSDDGSFSSSDAPDGPSAHMAVLLPGRETARGLRAEDQPLDDSPLPMLAISPDGQRIAYVGEREHDGEDVIFSRLVRDLEAVPLPATDDADTPFFSPDGEWIGFLAQGKLKKVAVQGGPAATLCDVGTMRGGTWGTDGTIVFPMSSRSGLFRVPDAGGEPEPLTLREESGEAFRSHRWPQYLPGNHAVIFTSNAGGRDFSAGEIGAYRFEDDSVTTLVQNARFGRFVPPSDGTGPRVRVSTSGGWLGRWAGNDELLYRQGGSEEIQSVSLPLEAGVLKPARPQPVIELPRPPWTSEFRVSPDGRRILARKRVEGTARRDPVVVINWIDELEAKVPAAK